MNINPVIFREALHKIPFSKDSWSELISLIKVSTDSQAGVMLITRDQNHDILESHSPDFQISPEVRDAFEKSEWITAALPENWSKGYLSKGVVLGTDIVPQKKMRQTPFYNDILRTLDLEYLMAGISMFGEDYRALLKFFRADKQPNFSVENASQLATLMPEIRQMMRFTERLYERMVIETAASKAGAPRGAATIIVNTNGEVVHANEDAEKLLSDGTVLSAKQNHLYAIDYMDSKALANLMETALGNNGTPRQSGSLIGKSSQQGVHQVLALPIPTEQAPFPWIDNLHVAAIVVIDPMRKVRIDSEILKTLYGITPAEIELVNAMANGIKPVKFAAISGKSVPTVQSQRQSVFQKVAVNNQLELMSVLRDLTISFEEPCKE